jgi:hypothetical protein
MSEANPPHNPPNSTPPRRREVRWDAVAAIIASLVGFLALIVAGYTAWIERYTADIQREQVRAQVWPYLISGNNDVTHALTVDNKGEGPAIVRSVQLRIDGRPQKDWQHVLAVMGIPPHHFVQTSINHDVLSPGERLQIIQFPDQDLWQRFHDAAMNRMALDICFCSTLGDCWISRNGNVVPPTSIALQLRVTPVDRCPRLPPADIFNN